MLVSDREIFSFSEKERKRYRRFFVAIEIPLSLLSFSSSSSSAFLINSLHIVIKLSVIILCSLQPVAVRCSLVVFVFSFLSLTFISSTICFLSS